MRIESSIVKTVLLINVLIAFIKVLIAAISACRFTVFAILICIEGSFIMKKEVTIKITLTDDNITLDGENIRELTENDVIDSIQMLVSLAKTLNILQEGDSTNGNA